MLRVENLQVFHGDAQALDDVSLEIGEGAIVAIVGANGAGKTSLIRTIAGMHRPTRGRIAFRDVDIGGWDSYRVCNLGIGQVAEGRQVFPTLSVAENLEVGAMLPRARASRARLRARKRTGDALRRGDGASRRRPGAAGLSGNVRRLARAAPPQQLKRGDPYGERAFGKRGAQLLERVGVRRGRRDPLQHGRGKVGAAQRPGG